MSTGQGQSTSRGGSFWNLRIPFLAFFSFQGLPVFLGAHSPFLTFSVPHSSLTSSDGLFENSGFDSNIGFPLEDHVLQDLTRLRKKEIHILGLLVLLFSLSSPEASASLCFSLKQWSSTRGTRVSFWNEICQIYLGEKYVKMQIRLWQYKSQMDTSLGQWGPLPTEHDCLGAFIVCWLFLI